MRALLISTYDLGRQPFGLASAAAALHAAGVEVVCLDLAREPLRGDEVRSAEFVAFFLPMHTATRLALPVVERVRALNPSARLCAYGLYAPLNEPLLRARGVGQVVGAEFEDDLVAAALGRGGTGDGSLPAEAGSHNERRDGSHNGSRDGSHGERAAPARPAVPRVTFRVPLRAALPPLSRYASVRVGEERRAAGYTEASRGCKHRCRHCPIVPVYDGRFRVVPIPIVLADVETQVAAGARHITFGDPDFFNGIRHATGLVRAFAAAFPGISYDVTIKIEHLIRHADEVPLLRDTGCLFVTSAVESVDDRILQKLEKGHTREDFERAVALCRASGVTLVPTFVAFTPWTTVTGYRDLLRAIDALDLVEHVAPIQLAIRLLVPQGSRLLELPDISRMVGPYSPAWLSYPWQHADPRVDALHQTVEGIVGARLTADRAAVFERVWSAAHQAAGDAPSPRTRPARARATIPYLDEPWYC